MHISPENKPVGALIPLSGRLSAIAESLPKGGIVCDVGSDHGALPLFLLQNHWCKRAIVTDLNQLPLKRAKKNLTDHGVANLADFVLTDGILEVLPYEANAYVVAGMGGETIVGILTRALNQIPINTVFVLQPMTKSVFLRQFLYENGFRVDFEQIVSENDKSFLIFKTVYDGLKRAKNRDFYLVGEYLCRAKEESVIDYWNKRLSKVRSKINGRKIANLSVEEEEREEALYLSILEELNENP